MLAAPWTRCAPGHRATGNADSGYVRIKIPVRGIPPTGLRTWFSERAAGSFAGVEGDARGGSMPPRIPAGSPFMAGWALGGLLQRTDAPAEGCGHLDVSVQLIAETSGQLASRKRPAVPAGTSSTRIQHDARRQAPWQRWHRSHASECNDASSAPRRRPHSRGKRVRAMRCRRARLARHPSASTDDRLTLASGGDCESADVVVVTSADRPDRSTRPRRFALVLSSRSARRRSRGRPSISLGFHRPGGFGAYGFVAADARSRMAGPPAARSPRSAACAVAARSAPVSAPRAGLA